MRANTRQKSYYRLITVPIIGVMIVSASCRTRYRVEQIIKTDTVVIEQRKHTQLYQIVERFDSLGRVTERRETRTIAQDSTQTRQHKKAQTQTQEKTSTAPKLLPSLTPELTPASLASGTGTLRLYALVFLAGLILGAYLRHRLRSFVR